MLSQLAYLGNEMVHHLGQSSRLFSPRLWKPVSDILMDPAGDDPVSILFDDFNNFTPLNIADPTGGATTDAEARTAINALIALITGYSCYRDTGGTIKQMATEHIGVAQFLTDTTDNDEIWMQAGGNVGAQTVISDTAANQKKVVFECRVRFPQVSDDYNGFIGLGEEGLAAADTISDAGVIASKDLIGFNVDESDGDSMNFIYRKASAALQTKIDGLQALVAGTWYKFGFIHDPTAQASQRIKVFVDNVEQSTYVTATDIAASTFPDGEELAMLAGLKNGTGAARKIDLDWWALGQVG